MTKTKKILQEIAYLLHLNGGRMNLLKLIKELYLADRLSIDEREESISGDIFYSMRNGPVLSTALDMLTSDLEIYSEYLAAEDAENDTEKYYKDIILLKSPGQDYLSKNDKKYLEHIFNKYKTFTAFDVVEDTHILPEWHPIKSGRRQILPAEILRALGRTEQEILAILQNNDTLKQMKGMLSGINCE